MGNRSFGDLAGSAGFRVNTWKAEWDLSRTVTQVPKLTFRGRVSTRPSHWLFSIPDVRAPPFGPAMLRNIRHTADSQLAEFLLNEIYEILSDRRLFPIGRIKPVDESTLLKFIDER